MLFSSAVIETPAVPEAVNVEPLPTLAFGTPRKLPRPRDLKGRVAVLDIAFAAGAGGASFEKTTLPFISGLGDRLAVWVDHHDHVLHANYAADSRFVLATKAEHGACPEMVTPELVARIGQVDTVCCHTDFDGLVSAAKWMRGGVEPYPGCDDDARAIDTRMGTPSAVADRIDRALQSFDVEPDDRKFSPHVTLARLRDGSRTHVMEYVSRHNLYRSEPFCVDRFKLYSSVLGSERAKYRVEAAFPLGRSFETS